MRYVLHLINLCCCLLGCLSAIGQGESLTASEQFDAHYNLALQYRRVPLYVECFDELEVAIEIAKSADLEKQLISAQIEKAETMRRTSDFDLGIDLLRSIEGSEQYPKLHLRVLSRLSALLSERGSNGNFDDHNDSIINYLQEAIELARQIGDEAEESSLLNNLGFVEAYRSGPFAAGPHYFASADLAWKLQDTVGYTRALVNALRLYELWPSMEEREQEILRLAELVEDLDSPPLKLDLYNVATWYYRDQSKEEQESFWQAKAAQEHVNILQNTHNQTMDALRVVNETEDLQEKAQRSDRVAAQKQVELDLQTAQNKQLAIWLALFVLLALVVVWRFLRERKLKAEVKNSNEQLFVANEKYHTLLVESNHRIKNNLQMIISMLEYTSKGLEDSENAALKSMSGKIHTISALHKHLYLDVHNERVNLGTYVREIITLYEDLAPNNFNINDSIDQVTIRSERIIYFGLIFNEMLSNTLEHSVNKNNKIELSVVKDGEGYRFSYCDQSPRPEDAKEGMGSTLIRQLIRRVGGNDYSFDPATGRYEFYFYG